MLIGSLDDIKNILQDGYIVCIISMIIIFVGRKVAVTARKYSYRQKHFENQVDWFDDAWNSRNRRWWLSKFI